MATKYVIAAVSVLFLLLACLRAARVGMFHPQTRTWLLVGVIFGVVSIYLFLQS